MSGEIIRVERHKKDYFTAQNEPFNDSRLSFGARGILAYLLSKPDDWELRNEDLYNQSPAGRSAVMGMLKELKECGYLRRYRVSDGKSLEWVTEIYETKTLNPDYQGNTDEGQGNDYPKSDSPNIRKPEGQKTDTSETRRSENPKIGKPTHIISTDSLQSTDSTSNTNVLEGGKPHPSPENLIPENGSTALIPIISALTVKGVKKLELSADEWRQLLADEQAGRNRVGVVAHIERQLNPTPPAILMYQQKSGRMPAKDLWDSVVDAVGDSENDVNRWGETVIWWRGHGYNPTNVFGMIEKFKENDLGGQNGYSTTSGSTTSDRGAEGKAGRTGGNARKFGDKPATDAQRYVEATQDDVAAYYAKISQ